MWVVKFKIDVVTTISYMDCVTTVQKMYSCVFAVCESLVRFREAKTKCFYLMFLLKKNSLCETFFLLYTSSLFQSLS